MKTRVKNVRRGKEKMRRISRFEAEVVKVTGRLVKGCTKGVKGVMDCRG